MFKFFGPLYETNERDFSNTPTFDIKLPFLKILRKKLEMGTAVFLPLKNLSSCDLLCFHRRHLFALPRQTGLFRCTDFSFGRHSTCIARERPVSARQKE